MKQFTAKLLKIPFKCLSIILTGVICLTATAQDYEIQHLEPSSWWVGMKSPTLQLLVHGEKIAELTPKISSQYVQITKVHRTSNKNYLFVDLKIKESTTAGNFTINFFKDNQQVLQYNYPLQARNTNSAADKSYSASDVIYLITPDRFANGDPLNDNVDSLKEELNRTLPGGRHGGDLQGLINQLDYISDMGFTQLWLNPVIENNQEKYSYHGYSATNFYQIDARYGNNELYKKLSNQAQKRGLGLIKDVVLNHIGSGHWWLKDLPTKDWLNYQDQAFTGTNHKRQTLHDPHMIQADKDIFTDGWFVPTMPDLNQRNAFIANYLIQNSLWWIEYANLSGLRVDTYSYSDKTFLTQWTKRITTEYPNINIVGEEWTTDTAIVSYWQRGKQTHDGYQSYLPSVMDFPLQEAIINSVNNEENWNGGLVELYEAIANDFQYADPYNLVIFPDNHDMSRIFTQLNEDYDNYKIAMTYLLTTRGIPQIFYGTEILMTNPGTDDHGVIRTDFPGGWNNDAVNGFTQYGLTAQQKQAQNFIKKLLNWRKSNEFIASGKLSHYAPKDELYVYFRHGDLNNKNGEKLMIVINKSTKEKTLNKSDYQAMLSPHSTATNVLNNKSVSLGTGLTLAGKSATIYQVK